MTGVALDPATSCTFAVNVVGTAVGVQNNTTSEVTSNLGPATASSATASITVTAPVPVMGPVALVLFALLLAGSAALLVRRRAAVNA